MRQAVVVAIPPGFACAADFLRLRRSCIEPTAE